ncbi:uncharacterized protein BXZ73DRAFT_100266 [Epithele typhae]|uniref:uncharacterized protein n=1 Tax=Epithele typhae TaxID=378194 RepID=UPI00200749F8|nr:uncharacterized protein BXZ73DRAFT_100266 [Epithele typhae]KAH9936847.1 hypothetical protein BXZ73DRAFT_100266 [Epithele typhae]
MIVDLLSATGDSSPQNTSPACRFRPLTCSIVTEAIVQQRCPGTAFWAHQLNHRRSLEARDRGQPRAANSAGRYVAAFVLLNSDLSIERSYDISRLRHPASNSGPLRDEDRTILEDASMALMQFVRALVVRAPEQGGTLPFEIGSVGHNNKKWVYSKLPEEQSVPILSRTSVALKSQLSVTQVFWRLRDLILRFNSV